MHASGVRGLLVLLLRLPGARTRQGSAQIAGPDQVRLSDLEAHVSFAKRAERLFHHRGILQARVEQFPPVAGSL